MKIRKMKGVSVIICCYNSAGRLTPTLQALSRQQVSDSIDWEIIVVDNASDDDTAGVAKKNRALFQKWPMVDLSIVYEPVPGLANARKRGILSARYSCLLFCDDDNWLAGDYVQGVFDILNSDSSVAACGGTGIPVFETAVPPVWFEHYKEAYAVGPQLLNEENGQLLNLYGAGMAVNWDALENLNQTCFKPQMTGRTGKQLSSAEDTELTYALVLAGYRLHYESKLQFFHYLPKERLDFKYLIKLFTAFGSDGPTRNLYYSCLSKRVLHRQLKYWWVHFLFSIFRLGKYFLFPPKKYGREIYLKWSMAYIKQLWLMRGKYHEIRENIWRLRDAGIYQEANFTGLQHHQELSSF